MRDTGFISKTTDGGANWTVQKNAETEAYYCIKFLNENTGWSAGDNNVVIKQLTEETTGCIPI